MPAVRAVLVVTRDQHTTERRELSHGTLVIGSGPGATLRIDDAAPLQAVLDAAADGYFLLDLAGTTTVNGAAIHRAPISFGDVIAIGSARLVLEKPRASVPAPLGTLSAGSDTIRAPRAASTAPATARPGSTPHFLAASSGRGAIEVAQLWGDSLVGLSHFRAPQPITLGESATCSFFVPSEHLPRNEFPLVTYRANEPIVHIPAGAAGHVERAGGDRLPLAAWLARGAADESTGASLPLAPGERIRLDVAPGLSLLLQRVDRTVPIGPPGLDSLDFRFVGVFASLLVAFLSIGVLARALAFLGLFAAAAPPGEDLARAATTLAMIDLPLEEIEKIRKTEVLKKLDPDAGNPNAGAGATMRGEEGARGTPDSKIKQSRGSATKLESDRPVDPNDTGVLVAIRGSGFDLPSIFGAGLDGGRMDDIIGVLHGPDTQADMNGTRGFGLKGKEKGGGGKSLTIDGYGPKGRVNGGYRGGGDMPGRPGKRECPNCFTTDVEEIRTYGYPPEWIDKVIKDHVAQIQYCYERRLTQIPTLSGKVLMKFTIAADGTTDAVAVDGSSTLADGEVSKCLVDRFRPLRFPKPPSKGTVGVKYPLLFKTAGN